MRKLNLNTKLLLLVIIPFLIFNMFSTYSNYTSTREALIKEKRFAIRDVISTAKGLMTSLDKQVKEKKISKIEAQKIAANYIRNLRYGANNDDYIWVNDFNAKMVVHPIKKSLEGKDLSAFKDKGGQLLFTNIANLAKEKGSGYITYLWSGKKDPKKNVPKLSYVSGHKSWGWVLGTGIYLDDVNDYLRSYLITESIKTFLGVFLVILLIYYLSKVIITTPLLNIAKRLGESADSVSTNSNDTKNTSLQLSQSTTEQASSLQETVSSIDEISAMINKSANSAEQSTKSSDNSRDVAQSGKQTIDQMLNAITNISDNNTSAMTKMEESNEQVRQILSIIKEIDDKTKVINDIVFQTKLLSFNASVEAARAGESGKGFAVVAEEVGNLATMSGKASDEIKELLEQSIDQVEKIVNQTSQMVSNVIESGSSAVKEGTQRANECKDALDEILSNVDEVNKKVYEISSACKEQSLGVEEITKAMRLLDQVTTKNSSVADDASNSATALQSEAENLKLVVNNVLTLVHGE